MNVNMLTGLDFCLVVFLFLFPWMLSKLNADLNLQVKGTVSLILCVGEMLLRYWQVRILKPAKTKFFRFLHRNCKALN